jgi:uncharacterized surface protein with fasciclin (FAS1) repeats
MVIAVLVGMLSVAAPAAASSPECTGTIVQVALCVNEQTGEFSTLIAALQAAGLVDTLNGSGQFTVFAPTDAAFAYLGLNKDNVGDLDTATLTNILLYHVTAGEIFSTDLRRIQFVKMLNDQYTRVLKFPRVIYVNRSKVVLGDVDASNGVIHVIDCVLVPRRH